MKCGMIALPEDEASSTMRHLARILWGPVRTFTRVRPRAAQNEATAVPDHGPWKDGKSPATKHRRRGRGAYTFLNASSQLRCSAQPGYSSSLTNPGLCMQVMTDGTPQQTSKGQGKTNTRSFRYVLPGASNRDKTPAEEKQKTVQRFWPHTLAPHGQGDLASRGRSQREQVSLRQ